MKIMTEEEKQAADTIQQFKDIKKNLKGMSKNQLITTVIQIMGAMAEQIRINKLLQDNINLLMKEEKNEDSISANSTI